MKPLRAPGDPAKVAKNYLASVVPAMVAPLTPTFGLGLPKNWTTASNPAVVVFDDSGPTQWPVLTAPTLRITVWADGRDHANTIAGRCLAVLMSQPIPGIATLREPSSPLEAVDSNNGGVMCSFTVRSQSRTVPA